MVAVEGYEVFAELERSAWVTIFKAHEVRQRRTVLIKIINAGTPPPAVQEQLKVERDLGRRLVHPNLRRVLDDGVVAGRAYLVLDYVEGPTLAELIPQVLPVELCAWITKEVAKALAAVHAQGLWHRDVKPQNVFISSAGEVKLGDLGLAVADGKESAELAGTPAYLSPEAVLGREVSARSDLFSLGAVLYEMLAAVPPFEDHTTSAILHRIANWEPVPVEKLRPEVPAELAGLCRQLLAKAPEQRPRDAEEVVSLLTQFEHNRGLRPGPKQLASYLEDPHAYPAANPPVPEPGRAGLADQLPPRRSAKSHRVVPALFLALVLFGLVLVNSKRSRQPQPLPSLPAPAVTAPAHPSDETGSDSDAPDIAAQLQSSPLPASPPAATELAASRAQAERPANGVTAHAVETVRPVAPDRAEGERPWSRTILLESEPRACVYVEGDSIGFTPLRWRLGQRDRVYELRFVSPGLPPVRQLVAGTIIESDTLRLNLWRRMAFIEVVVNPWGEIWLDGKPIDTTPLTAPIALSPGLHELAVRHPQLGVRTQRIVVSEGDTLRKSFDLINP